MSFIDELILLYGASPNPDDGFDAILKLQADFAATHPSYIINDRFDAILKLQADFAGIAFFPTGIDANLILQADFAADLSLTLVEPAPILNEIGSFGAQEFRAKFKVNGTAIDIKSFRFSKPKASTGISLNVELAKADLALIPNNAVYSFLIGKKISGAWTDYDYVTNGKLDARALALAVNNDTLSISTVELLNDRLNYCPRSNLICYDTSKTSVNVAEIEPLYDNLGHLIATHTRAFPILSLYNALNIAFVEGCGFDSIQTNIPNFEITRCDFEITNSYLEAVAGLIGVFEPVLFAVGNVLWILDKTQAIPDDFTPTELLPSQVLQFGANTQSERLIDGYVLQYLSNIAAATISEREVVTNEENGEFGTSSYSITTTTKTFRDWKDTSGTTLKTELVHELKDTHNGFTIHSELTNHEFDYQGKRLSSTRTEKARIPDVNNSLSYTLADVKEEKTVYSYTADPFNPRRVVPANNITTIKGLIAIDSHNKYLDQNFRQDYMQAHKAGNIASGMTSEFGYIKTETETFSVLGNGQIQVNTKTIDILRNTVTNSVSEVRSGDISLNGAISKPRKLIVWREGLDLSATKGAKLQGFAVGELPYIFALPLAQRRLKRQLNKPQTIRASMSGFDGTLERGRLFSLTARGVNLGNFLVEGFEVFGDANSITTEIDATEI